MTDDIEAIIESGSVAAIEIAASALAERGAKTGNCANCTHTPVGPYCANCGQPTKTRRRSIRGLVHDFFVDLVNFDSRILRTGRALLFQPGELPRAFRENRTVPYVPSIRLYFFVSLVFFVLLGLTGIAILQIIVTATPIKMWGRQGLLSQPSLRHMDAADAADPDVKKYVPRLIRMDKAKALRPGGHYTFSTQTYFFSRIGAYHSSLTPEQRQRMLELPHVELDGKAKATAATIERNVDNTMAKLAADPAALNGPLTTWIPRALFLLLPLYALILALFHIRRRKDFYLVDHLVFSLSIHTFAFVTLIAAALAQVISGELVAARVRRHVALHLPGDEEFLRPGLVLTTVKFSSSPASTIFCLLPAVAACCHLLLQVRLAGGKRRRGRRGPGRVCAIRCAQLGLRRDCRTRPPRRHLLNWAASRPRRCCAHPKSGT